MPPLPGRSSVLSPHSSLGCNTLGSFLTNAQRTGCLDLVLSLLWYCLLSAWKVSLLNSFTSLPMLVEIKSLQRQLLSLGSLYTPTPNPSITQVQRRPQDGLLLSPFAKPRWKKGPITAERCSERSWGDECPRALWKAGNQHSLGLPCS